MNKPDIIMSEEAKTALYGLRKFMFQNVYKNMDIVSKNKSYENYLSNIYQYYLNNFHEIPEEYLCNYTEGEPKERIICDYIAGMTDRFVLNIHKKNQT